MSDFDQVMRELEQHGLSNDSAQSDKSKKYLNNAISHEDELRELSDWVNAQANLSVSLVLVGKSELLVHKGPVS